MIESIDEYVIQLKEYKGKQLVCVTKEGFELRKEADEDMMMVNGDVEVATNRSADSVDCEEEIYKEYDEDKRLADMERLCIAMNQLKVKNAGIMMPLTRVGFDTPPVPTLVTFFDERTVMVQGFVYRLKPVKNRNRKRFICQEVFHSRCPAGLSIGPANDVCLSTKGHSHAVQDPDAPDQKIRCTICAQTSKTQQSAEDHLRAHEVYQKNSIRKYLNLF